MYLLAHEDTLRQTMGLPAVPQLWGANSCCLWKDAPDGPAAFARSVMHAPDKACSELGLQGDDRLTAVDELIVHSSFAAAASLASLLAAESQHVDGARGLQRSLYFRLKAVQAAIEGASYSQARSLLLQAERLLRSPDTTRTSILLFANIKLLWGTLIQRLELPKAASGSFAEARKALESAGLDRPPDWHLLEPAHHDHDLARELQDSLEHPDRFDSQYLHGGLAEHHRVFQVAVKDYSDGDWSKAIQGFKRSEALLTKEGHRSQPDPLRHAFTLMGRGRAYTRAGLEPGGKRKDVVKGLRLLLDSRWRFQSHNHPPGEYVAYRSYVNGRNRSAKSHNGVFAHRLDELRRLGHATGIASFQLQSSVMYAHALYEAGRPNAAHVAIEAAIRNIGDDDLFHELRQHPEWRQARNLMEVTADAPLNSVAPLQLWGLSPYAERERAFVQRASNPDGPPLLVCVSQRGAGRAILIRRIMEARGQSDNFWNVNAGECSAEWAEKATTRIHTGHVVLLHSLNEWSTAEQQRLLDFVSANAELVTRLYVTLDAPLELTRTLIPGLASRLVPGHHAVAELSTRLEDQLLLARGFLVRALRERLDDATKVIFTGQACEYILNRWTTVNDLNREMRQLAAELDPELDMVETSDGHLKLPSETIERLRPRRNKAPSSQESDPPVWQRFLCADIVNADGDTVAELHRRFGGNMASLSRVCGVSQTAIVAAWTKQNVRLRWPRRQHKKGTEAKQR